MGEVASLWATMGWKDSGYSAGMTRAEAQWGGFEKRIQSSSGPIGGISSSLGAIVSPAGLATAGIVAFGAAVVGATQASIGWESTMADVAKTAGASTDVAVLGDALLTMSTVPGMPVKEDLADIAANAGALGVDGTQNVLAFTDAIAKATTSFGGMAAGDVASNLAKMENVFGITADQSMNLAAAVDYVGNNLAATEAQVMPAAQKMSGLGAMYGMTATEALGLAGSLIDMGMQADSAGTLTSSLMTRLTDPAAWGKAGELIGQTADEFGRLATSDIDEAMLEIAEALEQIADPAERAQAIADLNLGTEAAQPLLKMVGHTKEIRANMEGTADAFDDTSDFIDNFDNKAGTSAASIGQIKAQVGVIAVMLGDSVNESGAFQDALDGVSGVLGSIIENMDTITGFASHLGSDLKSAFDEYTFTGRLFGELGDEGSTIGSTARSWGASLWAGIEEYAGTAGEEVGEELTNGIEAGTEDVPENLEDTLTDVDAEGAGKSVGDDFNSGLIEALRTGKPQTEAELQYLNSFRVGGNLEKEKNTARQYFEYLGKQWEIVHETAGGQFGWTVRADGTGMGSISGKWYDVTSDPVEAFEMMTGIPAPEVGTAAYYRLLGDEAAAKQVELHDELMVQSKALAEDAQRAFEEAYSEAFSGESFAVGGLGDSMTDLLADVAEDGWAAFENGMISAAEASDIAGQLADLKFADPEAFAEAGGQAALDWWSRFAGLLDQRSFNIANNIDCTGIDEELAKMIVEGGPYIAPIEFELPEGAAEAAGQLKEALFWEEYDGSKTQIGLGEYADDMYEIAQAAGEAGGEVADAYDIITHPWEHEAGTVGVSKDLLKAMYPDDSAAIDFIADYFVRNTEAGVAKAKTEITASGGVADWMSEFSHWQEDEANGMFAKSYIGRTEGWAGPGQGAKAGYEAQNYFQYTVEADLTVDPTEANEKINAVEDRIAIEKVAPVEANIDPALSDLARLEAEIMQPITKPVYLGVIGGSNRGAELSAASAWGGSSDWLPALASGGIVSRPMAAIVGDAPSPEVVAPLSDLAAIIRDAVGAGRGGTTIVIKDNVISEDTWPKMRADVEKMIKDSETRTSTAYRNRVRG